MKKIKLIPEENLSDTIIGISSLHQDFQVAWSLNNALEINLKKTQDISIRLKNGSELNTFSFSLFSHTDLDENYFHLLSNKDKGANLYSKYKNIDYFLIIKSEEASTTIVSKKIMGIDFLLGNFIIPVNNVLKKIIEKVFEN